MSDNEHLSIFLAAQMVRNEKPIFTKLFKHKNKVYKYEAYKLNSKFTNKILQEENKAVMYYGSTTNEHMTQQTISIDEIKSIINKNPIVGILFKQKGFKSDTNKRNFVGIDSHNYDNENEHMEVLKTILKLYTTIGKTKRDSQKNNLYKWEYHEFISDKNNRVVPVSKLKSIIKEVLKEYSIPLSKIKLSNDTTRSKRKLGEAKTFISSVRSNKPEYIIINVFDSSLLTMIHELAHVVVAFKYGVKSVQSHGPEFCGVYAKLLSMYGYNEDEIINSMTKNGLKVKRMTGKESD